MGRQPHIFAKSFEKTLEIGKKLVPGYHQGLVDLPMNSPVADLGARGMPAVHFFFMQFSTEIIWRPW